MHKICNINYTEPSKNCVQASSFPICRKIREVGERIDTKNRLKDFWNIKPGTIKYGPCLYTVQLCIHWANTLLAYAFQSFRCVLRACV
jgi:hypothetical protein